MESSTMFIRPIDYVLAVWFGLALLSAGYVAYDQFRHNPEATVMKWGFVLITLYMGPVGLLIYVLADKEPRPKTHEAFVKPLWKQGLGSTIHCCAGDATGIIAAAAITAAFGLPMWLDLIIEYVAGFSFGLFIFQALFMRKMMGGSYLDNVRSTFVPELISMNAMMAGMAPVMIVLMMGNDMRAMEPTELAFWAVMSLGVIVGFALAYPFNLWMVSKGLKHGLMTEREASGHAGTHESRKEQGEHASGAKPPEHEHASDHHAHSESYDDATRVTPAQIAAVAAMAAVLLAAGVGFPATRVNLSLGARDVGGAIMPPGSVMTRDTPGDAMRDMAAADPRDIAYRAPDDARGDQPLEPHIENGVKVFELETDVIEWPILPDVRVTAYAFNHQVPGPRLHITEGDHVRIVLTNHLPESTTTHWHGLIIPNVMDGPAHITQDPIEPGQQYVYEFTARQSGTYFYHTHDHVDRQQALGLYGALIIDPKNPDAEPKADHDYVIELQEWLYRDWLTYPAMPMDGAHPNFFTINGKAYPATDTIPMKVGETIKLRFIGTHSISIHPMHVHGGPFTVVGVDGNTLKAEQRYEADTINIGPGQRFDVIWTAREPGKWLVHCHIPHHTTNNNVEQQGGGGLMMLLDVAPN
jgi:FtsP/CotA-like multicopper oxidase with cupredoxin domain